MDERAYARYFQLKRASGQGKLARILDEILLRLILFGGAYLFFAAKLPGGGVRPPLLAGIFLLLCMLIRRICLELAMERFTRRELTRIRRLLMTDRLLLMDAAGIRALCGPLCGQGEAPLFLQQTASVSADALIAAIRSRKGKGRVGVFACGGFSPSAEELAARSGGMITLYPKEVLLDAAAVAGLTPTAAEVRAYIAGELRRMEQKRRRWPQLSYSLQAGRAGKYLLAALALTVVSFFTRYTLYYRLMAGLCAGVAGLGIFLTRTHRKEAP